jgi:hypothetical protein
VQNVYTFGKGKGQGDASMKSLVRELSNITRNARLVVPSFQELLSDPDRSLSSPPSSAEKAPTWPRCAQSAFLCRRA